MVDTNNQNTPLVAIRCITYNHESYIRDALDGFVMQKTNFPFVAIVHDDASTDKTAEIIREYAEKYPNIIKPIFETENQYSKAGNPLGRIMQEAIESSGAKYVAICEGDDYWTDSLKLQKQVDFLESHQEYSMCYSKARLYIQSQKKYSNTGLGIQYSDTKSLLFEKYSIPTATIIYKKDLLSTEFFKIKYEHTEWEMGDLPLSLYLSTQGKLYMIDDFLATYRILSASSSHFNSFDKHVRFIESAYDVKQFFASLIKCDEYELNKIFFSKNIELAHAAVKHGEYHALKQILNRSNEIKTFKFYIYKLASINQIVFKQLKYYINRK